MDEFLEPMTDTKEPMLGIGNPIADIDEPTVGDEKSVPETEETVGDAEESVSEAEELHLNPKAEYRKRATHSFSMTFFPKDNALWERLQAQDGKAEYVRRLIRHDIDNLDAYESGYADGMAEMASQAYGLVATHCPNSEGVERVKRILAEMKGDE